MRIRYQIDGNIFREISSNWLCAFVNECLIKIRKTDTDQAGNSIEYFQLNDGRVFTRPVSSPKYVEVPRNSNARLRNIRSAIPEPMTQPR